MKTDNLLITKEATAVYKEQSEGKHKALRVAREHAAKLAACSAKHHLGDHPEFNDDVCTAQEQVESQAEVDFHLRSKGKQTAFERCSRVDSQGS